MTAIAGTFAVVIVAAVVGLVGAAIPATSETTGNPLTGDRFYADPDSPAARAASPADGADAAAFESIASTPTAIWLLPEKHPTATVAGYVRGLTADASVRGAVPVFVVYGIPDRDCSGQSQGGLSEAAYPRWIAAIADGLGTAKSVIILEPDSLAQSQQCNDLDERVRQLGDDITALSEPQATIYLDGGHSDWLPAAQMAPLLQQAGVARVRGFASNVSNFNSTDQELSYDTTLSSMLGGAHFVIDTSRNGNGSNGEWCNPSGRALGSAPTVVDDGTAHDANLWIKPPGESDGTCNGGPPAGQWWDAAALALASGG
ncbi:MAG TPA: glycoside hydrolase family 6 protein [Lacisediminihabitans sp.]|uniref:glycoside hydrolase family 6 protein n=1 Tax=Lacisediminihabitans sp. TaxID=2787631 RepID=UPI002EDB6889